MGPYLTFFLFIAGVIFLIYFLIDVVSEANFNNSTNKWTLKTLWIWLPFYALIRLIKEVILRDDKK